MVERAEAEAGRVEVVAAGRAGVERGRGEAVVERGRAREAAARVEVLAQGLVARGEGASVVERVPAMGVAAAEAEAEARPHASSGVEDVGVADSGRRRPQFAWKASEVVGKEASKAKSLRVVEGVRAESGEV